MNQTRAKNVLILGLGASGLALARWCARRDAQITVVDTRSAPPQLAALRDLVPSAVFVHAPMSAALLDSNAYDLILKSPGLSPGSVAEPLAAAQARNIDCSSELGVFVDALSELATERGYAPKIIAITGTNGKTTVTSLAAQLVQRAGRTVVAAGNIGPTLLQTLADRLDQGQLPEVWVLELSSFQLDRIDHFQPTVATVLNVTQDHLDWHGSMANYIQAKFRIFGNGLMLLNRNDAAVMAALPPPVKGRQPRPYVTFGWDEPARPGDYGIEDVGGMAWLVRALEADETIKRRKDDHVLLHIQRLMPVDALRIRGRHNACNALGALALAHAAGCPLGPMLHGLRDYAGEPHRVEPVAVIDDVEYFDDSKGTNVGATVAALRGLGAERKLVLIAGGEGKGQDFSPLAEPVSLHVRAVVTIGRDAALIVAALQTAGVPLLQADSMQHAVTLAMQQARSGDAVLMSPACASFDMFENYEHRARVFCAAVQALAADRGVVA